jgi:hypothetical protein
MILAMLGVLLILVPLVEMMLSGMSLYLGRGNAGVGAGLGGWLDCEHCVDGVHCDYA